MIRNKIVQAMDSKFRAELMAAQAKLEVYLENPVGVGEHPDIPGEAAKCVTEICEATEKIKYVQGLYENEGNEDVYSDSLEDNVNTLVNKMDNFLTALGGDESKEEK